MYFPGLVKVNINGGINLFEGMPCVKFTADVPRKHLSEYFQTKIMYLQTSLEYKESKLNICFTVLVLESTFWLKSLESRFGGVNT